MPIDPGPGRLTGPSLRQYVGNAMDGVRTAAGIRSKASIPDDPSGQAALRYVGKNMAVLAQAVSVYFGDTEGLGIHVGLGFGAKEFAAAWARVQDTQSTD